MAQYGAIRLNTTQYASIQLNTAQYGAVRLDNITAALHCDLSDQPRRGTSAQLLAFHIVIITLLNHLLVHVKQNAAMEIIIGIMATATITHHYRLCRTSLIKTIIIIPDTLVKIVQCMVICNITVKSYVFGNTSVLVMTVINMHGNT